MTWGILSLLCIYNAVTPTSAPAISSRTAARAAAEPHTRDSAHQQPGEPPDRDEPPCLLLDEVERRQEARGRRDQTRDRHRPGQLNSPVHSPASASAPVNTPKPTPQVASDAAASPPPASAAARSPRDPCPD